MRATGQRRLSTKPQHGHSWLQAVGIFAATIIAFGLVASGASASPTPPLKIGHPGQVNDVADAVGTAGTAYVAWTNQRVSSANYVQYCVLDLHAKSCTYSGKLTPAGGEISVSAVQVVIDPPTIAILAEISSSGDPATYGPEQEWVSTNGGKTFSAPVNGGESVADGNIDGDTNPLSAVVLPGTGWLGYGWDSAVSPPTFDAFPLNNPPECSNDVCHGSEIPDNGPFPFAQFNPTTGTNQVANSEGNFVSDRGVKPGVLGIFFDDASKSSKFYCKEGFGTAYVYGSGDQATGTNDYSISPGQTGSAWKKTETPDSCDIEYAVAGGGRSGFGVLEANDANDSVTYQPFDQSTEKFRSNVTIVHGHGEEDGALSQDGAHGVYATYLLSGDQVELSYSPNAGVNWSSSRLDSDTEENDEYLTSSVDTSGLGWAAWANKGYVYVQPFARNNAIVQANVEPKLPKKAKSTETKLSLTLDFPVASTAVINIKHGTLSFASRTVTVHKGKQTISMKLTSAGKRLFKKDHYKADLKLILRTKNVFGSFIEGDPLSVTK